MVKKTAKAPATTRVPSEQGKQLADLLNKATTPDGIATALRGVAAALASGVIGVPVATALDHLIQRQLGILREREQRQRLLKAINHRLVTRLESSGDAIAGELLERDAS